MFNALHRYVDMGVFKCCILYRHCKLIGEKNLNAIKTLFKSSSKLVHLVNVEWAKNRPVGIS